MRTRFDGTLTNLDGVPIELSAPQLEGGETNLQNRAIVLDLALVRHQSCAGRSPVRNTVTLD